MKTRYSRAILAAGLATAVVLAVLFRDHFDANALQRWIEGLGYAGPLAFVALYALGTVLFLPGLALTLAGGALFGPVIGTLLNLSGATIGATLAFLAARHLGSDWVERRVGGRLKRLKDGVDHEGWRFVAFVRLVPLFPFNLLNYALGLTGIRLRHYVIASLVFMLPGATAYTWLGYAGREAISGDQGLIEKVLIALALLATVAFLPRLISRWRQQPWLDIDAFRTRQADAGDLVLDVRSATEFNGEQGHIEGAFNIPVEDLQARMAELGDDLARPINIVCRTDRRSAKAASLLARVGFSQARVVRGGMTAWLDQGWPVKRDGI